MKKLLFIFALAALSLGASAQTPTYVPLSGGDTSLYIADGATWGSVLAFGAYCDGIHDDTTAIQAGITWEAAHYGTLTVPSTLAGCNISNSLVIPLTQQFRFVGQCKTCSIINMTVDNKPIIVAGQADSHSIEIGQMTLQWTNQQTTSDPLSYGIEWTNIGGVAADGFYRWSLHDLQIMKPYVGLGTYSTSGQVTIWNSDFRNILIARAAHSGISLVPSSVIGMPVSTYAQISINNAGAGAPVPDGPAIILLAAEADIAGLDVEGWKNEAVWATGGGFVNIRGCHIEHETLSTSGRFFYMANGPISIEGCSLAIDGTPTLANAQVIGEGPGVFITMHNVTAFIVPSGSIYWTTGNAANSLDFLHLNDSLGGFTSMTGVVPLSAFASWPDVLPLLKQNQSAPQLIQVNGTNTSTSSYMMNLGPNYGSPGTVYFSNASSNNWHVNWTYVDLSQVYHYQKCSDEAGSSAGPPTSTPTGCTDQLTIDASGNVNLGTGNFRINGNTVIPSTAAGKVTSSITPAAVTASTCAEQTFTFTGAATSQLVSITPPASSVHTWISAARVTGTNTVGITFCGDSTSGTPPSGNYIALLL